MICLSKILFGNDLTIKAMKKILLYIAGVVSFAACNKEIVYDTDYNVLLDEGNTYLAGDPVKFNFTGNVDNIVFYSGEPNKEYQYKDRYVIDIKEVLSADLTLRMQGRYGYDGLDIYITDKFDGLNGADGGAGSMGENAYADREMVKEIAEDVKDLKVGETSEGGWKKIFTFWTNKNLSSDPERKEVPNQQWKTFDYQSIESLKENFCIAFHYNPEWRNKNQTQRDYWIDGHIALQLQEIDSEGNPGKAAGNAQFDFSAMSWQFVHMHDADGDGNEYPEGYNPSVDEDDGAYRPYVYAKDGKNGNPYCYCDINSDKAPLVFVGAPNTDNWIKNGFTPVEKHFNADIWAFSKPGPLNRVAADKGTVIKNMQNYLNSYEYTFEKPGLYEVVFVGINHNYAAASKEIHKLRINILDKIDPDL